MKCSLMILLFSVTCALADDSYSQSARVSLDMKNVAVKDVLNEIERTSEFYFLYSSKLIDVDRKVNIYAENQPIKEILNGLFASSNVDYVVIDRQIVLSTGETLSGIKSRLEPRIIIGKVTDENGEPLIGVAIVVKGTTVGAITDINGNYEIQTPSGAEILVFSFVGMLSQEVPIGDQSVIDVSMKPDLIGLEEVVVVGYGSTKRSDITGSISTVHSEDLTITPITSTSNALVGMVPGLQAQQGSGEPGADASRLSIRGFGPALVIVDGVEQAFDNISSNEIESISVLKDASAAIYGARAGNGVILVTTKRGRPGKPVLSFNSSYTISGNINYPKALTAGQYTELYREAQINTGVDPALTKYSEEDIQKYYAGTDPDYSSTNWWEATMNDWSPMLQNNISMRGGGENVSYYAYLGNMHQVGMFKTGDNVFDRYNVRSNIDANITKNLAIELNLSAIIGDRSRSAQGIEEGGQFWNTFFWCKPTHPAFLPDRSKVAYCGGPLALNPVINTDKDIGGYNQINTQNLRGSLALKYNILGIKGLYAKAFGDYQYVFTDNKTFSKKVQTYTYSHATGEYTSQLTTGPTILVETMTPGYIFTGQFSLNFSRVFNDNHEISALALYEIITSYNKWMQAYRRDFLSSSIDYLFAGASGTQQNNGSATESGRESYIGRLNYKYKNKYLAEVTLRYDGSPNFPSDTRWGLFPSISAGWIISEESFIRNNVNWLSILKLRASYSNTGYDNIGAFQYIAGFTMGQRHFALDGVTQMGIAISGIPNPNITWEEMTTYNAGLDFGLFNNSLYGEADVFYRLREGILGTRVLSLPSTFGAVLPDENINSSSNRGMEFLLGFRKSAGDFIFDVSGNISWARVKWVHFDEPEYTDPDDIRINKKSGEWTDLIWGYKTDGLFTSQDEIDNLDYDLDGTGNTTVHVGDIKYLNLNGDDKLDWRDYTIIGKSGLPKTMFGLNFKVDYKSFDLTGLLQGAAGRTVNVLQGIQSEQSVAQNVFKYRWTEENPDPDAIYPRQSFSDNNRKLSSYWLKEGTYLRLKTISLGYNFPKQLIGKIRIENLRLYVSGTNLFTISGLGKYNYDPENPGETALGFGFPGAVYPHQKTITVGLNLTL